MITYYLTLSRTFPSTHPKAGKPTGFKERVLRSINSQFLSDIRPKVHTIRANYLFWKKRFEKIARGEACLSIREWEGKPYGKGSRQVEIARLTREDGIGIQKLNFGWRGDKQVPVIEGWYMDGNHGSMNELAKKDGLSLKDWKEWFNSHEKDTVYDKPMAIIHFTKFRY